MELKLIELRDHWRAYYFDGHKIYFKDIYFIREIEGSHVFITCDKYGFFDVISDDEELLCVRNISKASEPDELEFQRLKKEMYQN